MPGSCPNGTNHKRQTRPSFKHTLLRIFLHATVIDSEQQLSIQHGRALEAMKTNHATRLSIL